MFVECSMNGVMAPSYHHFAQTRNPNEVEVEGFQKIDFGEETKQRAILGDWREFTEVR